MQIRNQNINKYIVFCLQFADDTKTRYEVPINLPVMNLNQQAAKNRSYDVEVKTNPFAIIIRRKSTNTIMYAFTKQ